MAAYSSSFVLREYWRYGSGSEGTRPMSRRGQQPRQLVDGHAPVERHAVGGPGLGDGRLDRGHATDRRRRRPGASRDRPAAPTARGWPDPGRRCAGGWSGGSAAASPSAMKARRGWRDGSNSRGSALFMTTVILSGGTPRAIESSRSGSWTVMSSSATAADARATPGDERHERPQQRRAEAVAEELGHVLVEVEQQRHAAELLGQGREGEEVRHGRHLHEVVSAPAMLARQAPGGHGGEGHVLGEVARRTR